MTDATHRVTQSTVEAFAREYLRALGGSIRENETHWRVTLPSDVDVESLANPTSTSEGSVTRQCVSFSRIDPPSARRYSSAKASTVDWVTL